MTNEAWDLVDDANGYTQISTGSSFACGVLVRRLCWHIGVGAIAMIAMLFHRRARNSNALGLGYQNFQPANMPQRF